jgi:hypothetical protein
LDGKLYIDIAKEIWEPSEEDEGEAAGQETERREA